MDKMKEETSAADEHMESYTVYGEKTLLVTACVEARSKDEAWVIARTSPDLEWEGCGNELTITSVERDS